MRCPFSVLAASRALSWPCLAAGSVSSARLSAALRERERPASPGPAAGVVLATPALTSVKMGDASPGKRVDVGSRVAKERVSVSPGPLPFTQSVARGAEASRVGQLSHGCADGPSPHPATE